MYKNTCFYTGQNLNIGNDYHCQDSTIVLHKNIYMYIFKIIVSKFEFSKCTFYFIRLVLYVPVKCKLFYLLCLVN